MARRKPQRTIADKLARARLTANPEGHAASTGANARAQQRSVTSAGVGYDPIAVIPGLTDRERSDFRAALRAVRTPRVVRRSSASRERRARVSAISSCAEASCRFYTTTNPALIPTWTPSRGFWWAICGFVVAIPPAQQDRRSAPSLPPHSLDSLARSTGAPLCRMIAASIVLYVGLGIVIAVTVWNHWKARHPEVACRRRRGELEWTDRLDSSAPFRNRLLLYLERRALGVGRWRQSSGTQSHRGSVR
jgi:hypothetical protein